MICGSHVEVSIQGTLSDPQLGVTGLWLCAWQSGLTPMSRLPWILPFGLACSPIPINSMSFLLPRQQILLRLKWSATKNPAQCDKPLIYPAANCCNESGALQRVLPCFPLSEPWDFGWYASDSLGSVYSSGCRPCREPGPRPPAFRQSHVCAVCLPDKTD